MNISDEALKVLEQGEEPKYVIWLIEPYSIDITLISELMLELPEQSRKEYLRRQFEFEKLIR